MSHYRLSRALFLRSLGAIYACAFASLLVQIDGLVGSHGILPAREMLDRAREVLASRDMNRFLALPTLFWLDASDAALQGACWLGIAVSLAIALGVLQRACLLVAWALYLSICCVGGDFLYFQWDALLLETGLCAFFFAGRARDDPPLGGLLLVRWLLFRLMLLSGAVKLASKDPVWFDFTALDYHFWTQPLPTWIGWWAHQLPSAWRRFACGSMFAIELVLPFFVFGPRRLRRIAAVGFLLLQLVITLTGNYGFFNLLTVALCIPLLDDAALCALVPERLRSRWSTASRERRARKTGIPRAASLAGAALGTLLALAIATLGGIEARARLDRDWNPPAWSESARDFAAPFRSVNAYGLFSVMTRERGEIVIEGSDDRVAWKPYLFRHKPCDAERSPSLFLGHMPRLDWQMWFAALSSWRRTAWFRALQRGLLRGEAPIEALFEENPFPTHPPRYLRASFERWRFTTRAERAAGGAWWHVEPAGAWSPVLALDEQGELALAE
jgi:hypothetical protein